VTDFAKNSDFRSRPFFGVELKIGRARLHGQTLRDSIEVWLNKKPLTATSEFIEGRFGYRLVVDQFGSPPLLEHWALLVGDCVHNLRSALDNLVYGLARLKADPPSDPRGIQFPIFTSKEAFEKSGAVKSTLQQLPHRAAELVTAWQPFHRETPDHIAADALNLLNHLSNQDKHRLPQVVLLSINQRDHQVQLRFDSDEDAQAFIDGPPKVELRTSPIDVGTALIQVVGSRRIADMAGKVTIEAVPAIQTLRNLEGVVPVIDALGRHVTEIFQMFRGEFPNSLR
jgi:hypothetical protein